MRPVNTFAAAVIANGDFVDSCLSSKLPLWLLKCLYRKPERSEMLRNIASTMCNSYFPKIRAIRHLNAAVVISVIILSVEVTPIKFGT